MANSLDVGIASNLLAISQDQFRCESTLCTTGAGQAKNLCPFHKRFAQIIHSFSTEQFERFGRGALNRGSIGSRRAQSVLLNACTPGSYGKRQGHERELTGGRCDAASLGRPLSNALSKNCECPVQFAC